MQRLELQLHAASFEPSVLIRSDQFVQDDAVLRGRLSGDAVHVHARIVTRSGHHPDQFDRGAVVPGPAAEEISAPIALGALGED